MRKFALWCLLIGIAFFCIPFYAGACSCAWKGPFLAVAKDAPLVIHGRILRHHPGQSPTMDVLVLETLKGGVTRFRNGCSDGRWDALPTDPRRLYAAK